MTAQPKRAALYGDGRDEPPLELYEADGPGGVDERSKNGGRVADATGKRRLHAENVADFLAREIAPREMILDPIIPAQGLAMIHSWRGVGKTHIALNMAYAVATGGKFLRWNAPQSRGVLYIDGEMPAKAMQERLAAIVAGADKEPPTPEFLRIVTPDLQADPMPNLATPEGQKAVEALLDGVNLLVIDNLSTLVRTDGENEADAWDVAQSWLLSLRRRSVSVLLIHHSGKGGQQRGTSRREDVLDTVISLRRPRDYEETEGARFEVHYEKARGAHGDAIKPFEARLEVRDGKAVWIVQGIDGANLARAKALFEEGFTVREVADEIGISKSAAGRLKQNIGAGGDGHA